MECVSSPSIIAIENTLLRVSAKKNVLEGVRTISVAKAHKPFLLVVFNNIKNFKKLPKWKNASISLIIFKTCKILGLHTHIYN